MKALNGAVSRFSRAKIFLRVFTFSVAALGGLAIYNNMAPLSADALELVKESQTLQLQINDPSFTAEARQFLAHHKKVVSNHLAAATLARSCAQLLSYDHTLLSGRYILYPTGNLKKRSLYSCVVSSGALVSASFVRDMVRKGTGKAAPGRPRFSKTVTLNFAASGPNRVNIVGVRGMPLVVEKLTTARCKMNVDFGFDATGIWVKNGCSARFKVPVIMPLSDRTITSTASNLNPVIGHMNLPTFEGDNVAVTGWACEKDKATAVNLQLYMGGPAGVGTFLRSTVANLESGSGVIAKCDPTGALKIKARGFKFVVPASRVDFRRLYVHAVSSASAGTSNGSLKGSRARIIPPNPKSFPGSNQCGTVDCSLEDPRDKLPAPSWSRYLINNDEASIDQRCIELGYAYGEATEFYTHAEWCHYSNARTKYWDGGKWVLGGCRESNVKRAVCH